MVRRHTTTLRAGLMAADFFGGAVLFVLVSLARYGPEWFKAWDRLGVDPLVAAALYGAGWTTLVGLQGLYRVRARFALRSEVIALVRAGLVLGVGMIVFLFVERVSNASRLLIGSLIIATVLAAIGARLALRAALITMRRHGYLSRYVLVAGAGSYAEEFANWLEDADDLGLQVIGHLRAPSDEDGLVHRPVVGTLDEIETVLHSHVVDEVAICLPVNAWNLVEPVTQLCASEGKIVRIPAEGGPLVHGSYVEDVDGIKIASLVHGPDRALSLFAKRAFDIAVSSVALVLGSPLTLGIALYLRHSEGSPVIYGQTRIGLNGRPFRVLKFRTMIRDADKQIRQLEPFNEVRGRAFKITQDPRLTRTGSVLRRTSLDELPQLWNVLRGEMSLVGPRPPLPEEVAGYDVWHRRRLSMKPGITGLWQVSARDNPDFDQWVERDLEYIDRWSLWLDLKIMARTVPAVVNQQGR